MRSVWALATLTALFGCKNADPLDQCPSGTVSARGACLVACAGPQDCLSIETCDLSIGACVPSSGEPDAGLKADAQAIPDSGASPDASDPTDATDPIDSGPPGALKYEPEVLDFGVRATGCGAGEIEFLIFNDGPGEATISGVFLLPDSDAVFEVERLNLPRVLQSREGLIVTVRHRPQVIGDQTGTLVVESSVEIRRLPLVARTIDRNQRESFTQNPGYIDIAFFIERSVNGGSAQDLLVQQLHHLFGSLDARGYSWQIAVAPADAVNNGMGPIFVGQPLWIDNTTPDRERELAERVRLGSASNDARRLFSVAVESLVGLAGTFHAGFLRPEASQLNIFVSYDDDASNGRPQDYASALESVLGQGNEPHTASNAITRTGNSTSLCGALGESIRIQAVASGTGGYASEICDGDFSMALSQFPPPRTTAESFFTLSAPAEPGSLTVFVNGAEQSPDGWTYDGASSTIGFAVAPPFSSVIEVGYRASCN